MGISTDATVEEQFRRPEYPRHMLVEEVAANRKRVTALEAKNARLRGELGAFVSRDMNKTVAGMTWRAAAQEGGD